MDKKKAALLERKRCDSAIWSLIYDLNELKAIIASAIKQKELSKLKSAKILHIVLIIVVAAVIYDKNFAFNPVIFLIFTILTALAYEVIKVKWFLKYERYDAFHNVYRAVNTPYGDQDFMSEEEEAIFFDRSNDINDFTGMILGVDSAGYMVSKNEKIDSGSTNTFIVGNTGTKKGVANIIPKGLQMIHAGRSGVIASTKDDNWATLSNIAKENGYTVKVLNLRPGELEHSDGFDMMKIIDERVDVAQAIALCITQNTSPGERPDYWWRGEKHLLFAMLISFSMRKQTLTDLFKALNLGLDYIEAELHSISPENPAYDAFCEFSKGGRQPKEQVVQGLAYRLAMFMSGTEMQDILKNDDIDLDLLTKKKCLYFVIVDDKSEAYRALSSTFFFLVFFRLGKLAAQNKESGSLDAPVEIILDEAFAVGAIPGFDSVLATTRGYKINITTCLQDIPQLHSMYPDTYKSILNNCGIKVCAHTDDEETAKYFSELAGTFTAESEHKDKNSEVTGVREVKVDLLSVSQIMSKSVDEQIVYITGAEHPTIILKKQLWYADWPGSKFKFFNKYNGSTYYSHPLLKDFKYDPIVNYTPKRLKMKKAGEKLGRVLQKQ